VPGSLAARTAPTPSSTRSVTELHPLDFLKRHKEMGWADRVFTRQCLVVELRDAPPTILDQERSPLLPDLDVVAFYVLLSVGWAHLGQGHIASAVVEYGNARNLFPDSALAHFGYAVAVAKFQKTDDFSAEAAKEFQQVLRVSPDSKLAGCAQVILSMIHHPDGSREKALRAYKEVLEPRSTIVGQLANAWGGVLDIFRLGSRPAAVCFGVPNLDAVTRRLRGEDA